MRGNLQFAAAVSAAVSLAMGSLSAGCDRDVAVTPAQNVRYAPDGSLVVFTPAGIKVYDTEMAHEQKSIQLAQTAGTVDVPFTFDLARDGATAAVSYANTVTRDVVLLHMPDGKSLATIDAPAMPHESFPVQQVRLSPHGDLVYLRGPAPGVYDAATGQALWADTGEDSGRRLPVFSPDGATLFGAVGTATGARVAAGARVEAVDARTGALRFGIDAPVVTALDVMPDGQLLVGIVSTAGSGARTETYVFWSTADGSVVKQLPQFAGTLSAPVFPDGSQVRCATADGPCATVATDGDQLLALVWNPDGTLLHTLPGYANDISFSPDGAVLAVGGAGARVYRVADGALVAERQYKYDSF